MNTLANKPLKVPESPPNPTVRIDAEATKLLGPAAKKAGMHKGEYASAAIKYFAKLGLDPRTDVAQGLSVVGSKVSKESRAIRDQNVDIGNQLVEMIRMWKESLYAFMQVQQQSTFDYLGQIEDNLLQQQATLEATMLAPLVEQVIRAETEAGLACMLSDWTYSRLAAMPSTDSRDDKSKSADWGTHNKAIDKERRRQNAEKLRDFVIKNHRHVAHLTPKPAGPPVPPESSQ